MNVVIPYPLLFGMLTLLNLLQTNYSEITTVYLSNYLTAVGLVLFIILLIWGLTRLVVKHPQRSALIASILIIFFISSGALFYQFHQGFSFLFFKITLKKPLIFLALSSLITCTLITMICKLSEKKIQTVHQFFSIYATLLFALSVWPILGQINWDKPQPKFSQNQTLSHVSTATTKSNLPDIYYIILDEYANAKTLKALFHFNNEPFLNQMKAKGFYLAENSTSNYSQTAMSIPSSLNLDYLNLHQQYTDKNLRAEALKHLLQENKAMTIAKTYGYKTINFSTAWGLTNHLSAADINVSCGSFNEFSFLILKQTIAGLFIDKLNMGRRDLITCPFERIPDFAKQDFPKFVFAHIISPHSPYLFDKNGHNVEDIANLNIASEAGTQPKPYIEQLQFINQKILALTDQIIQHAKHPPIIIIQSDHGTASQFPTLTAWNHPTPAMVTERMQNLSLFYVPDSMRTDLYPTITPVNTFRVVYKHLFGLPFNNLPDTNYYSSYVEDRRWIFTDVTALIKKTPSN